MSDTERVELSEAIKTILDDEESSFHQGNKAEANFLSPVSSVSKIKKSDCTPNATDPRPNSSPILQNACADSNIGGHNAETPLSRKSSLLQRSLGSGYSSTPPKKRRHAHEVIILRPPKKRASGSTPRVTSTSKLVSKDTKTTPNGPTGRRGTSPGRLLQTTPVSSLSQSRINVPSRLLAKESGRVKKEPSNPAAAATAGDHVTPTQMFFLDGGENLTPKEREDLELRAQYLSQSALGQQGMVMPITAGMEGMPEGCSPQVGQGSLSLSVGEQMRGISLVARAGNQDDSLTNITWLRRMSAPDLDLVTQPDLKDPHGERPPYSYSSLIQFAISSVPEGKMTLRDIYFWIETNFPYFRSAKLGWKNSIRHNLSLHKIFVREAPSGPGQPAYWTLRPGTIVRLPERRIIVHDEMAYRAGMSECFMPDGTPIDMAAMGNPHLQGGPAMNPLTGDGILVTDSNGVPMLPTQDHIGMDHAPVFSSTPVLTRPNHRSSRRVPPPILPKGASPYALVPLPIYFTADPKTGQLVPANGENPLPPPVELMSPPSQPRPTHKVKKKKKTAPKQGPKTTPSSRLPNLPMEYSSSTAGRTTLDSGYGSGDSCLGDDKLLLAVRDSMLRQTSSVEKGGDGKENVLVDDLELDIGNDLLQTPPKTTYPEWLSPIRGFTPGRDAGFPVKDMDFNFTPFKTGFTPNHRVGHSNTPRHLLLSPPRKTIPNALGGDVGNKKSQVLTTPKRQGDRDSASTSFHNLSFDQMFGDVNFDVDPDNIDVGNISWLLQSPK
ncbi:uncharacterized protein [Diadema setosum]|uniref:uncharacterized protein n=1 Tax=Diadema setosum TaxID=31175 RepID=UPI003B3B26C0